VALKRSTARRYAEAAFEIAQRDSSVDAWLAAFAVAAERLASPEIVRLLSNPSIPAGSRIGVLDRVLGGDVVGAPRNLMALMIQRGRFEQWPAVQREFRRLHYAREGIVEATVTSAASLTPGEIDALRRRLEDTTGQRVELHAAVDTDLLGGISVRIGDRLIDGSVRGRLERLRAELSTLAT
jgi:F-type H+-transporting ATPase subunit delta